MRKIIFIVFLFSVCAAWAGSGSKRIVADSVQIRIDNVKDLLFSNEWKPIDTDSYNRMLELVEYIENSPIDTVLVNLKSDIDSLDRFFKRDIHYITEVDEIEGYVNAQHINNQMINIDKRVADEMPLESILVPEDKFTGMYTKIPLITYGNIEQLITDSIVSYPDSLLLLIAEKPKIRNQERIYEIDSVLTAFLDEARKNYNDSIISYYRDSVTTAYRKTFQQNYADSLRKDYTNRVAVNNMKVLKAYNDSVSVVVNQNLKSQIDSLISYVHHLPNSITFYNLQNESTTFNLKDNGSWFQWLWLKNAQNDSIGIRIENLDKHSVRVLVDETVNLSRMTQRKTVEINKIEPSITIEQQLKKVNTRKPELSNWKLKGKAYSGFTETFINQAWSKGGKTSASALSTFSYDANYSKGKLKWENGVDAKLGLIYYIEENPAAIRNWHKSSDNFELNSRFGYSAFKEWYYSAEANFKTQFFLGFKNNTDDTPNSSLLSPAYLTFSGGFDFKPNKKFSAFLSPISVKTTYVSNPDVDETKFGLEEGATRKSRIGMTGRVSYANEIFEGVSVKTKNSIFVNFGMKDDEWQFFKLPDFDTETSFDFKVNQFITTQVNFHLIYDKEVESTWNVIENGEEVEMKGTRLQLKQFLTLGISYNF